MLARVKPDADAAHQALDRVRMQLLSGALHQTPAKPRILRIWQQPWTKMAVAAAVVFAVTWGGALWLQPDPTDSGPVAKPGDSPVVETPVMPRDQARLTALLSQERLEVDRLSAAGDHRGLAALLVSRAQPATQAVIAERLSQLGDSEDIASLEAANERWTGPPEDNPFTQAIAGIRERLDVAAAAKDGARGLAPGDIAPVTSPAGFEARGILSGVVTDTAGQPIAGLDIDIVMINGFSNRVKTDAAGQYSLDMIADPGVYYLRPVSYCYLVPREARDHLQVTLGYESRAIRHLQLERGCQVEVEVVNENGQPVKDVQLIASWMGSDRANDVGQPIRTDMDGHAKVGAFAASEIAYLLTAFHEEYALQRATVKCSDPIKPVYEQMVLRPGRSIAGHAVYADGTPAQGVQIVAKPHWWQNQTTPAGAPVDRDGAFELRNISPGSYGIEAFVGHSQAGVSYQVTQMRLPLDDAKPLEVILPMEPPQNEASIRGHLVFQGADRPELIYLMASSQEGTILPRQPLDPESDVFVLENLRPGDYTLVFDGPQIRETVLTSVPAPGEDLDITLDVVPTPMIAGEVWDARTGVPVNDFRVEIMKERDLPGVLFKSKETAYTFADVGGRFELPSEGPGSYRIRVIADGYVSACLDGVDTDDPQPVVFNLSMGGRIEGRVLAANSGLPLPQAKVFLLASGQENQHLASGLIAAQGCQVVTDAQGRFVLPHVAEGSHLLRVECDGYSSAWSPEVTVWDDDVPVPVQMALEEGASLEGRVFDADGEPEAHVTLLIHDGNGGGFHASQNLLATMITDDAGYYRAEGLPAHICFVQRRDWDRVQGVVCRAVVPVAGQTVQLDLGGGSRVSGTLVMDDQPVTHRRVLIADSVNPRSRVFRCIGQTDSQGRFSLSGQALGQYGLYIQDPTRWNGWLKLRDFQVGSDDVDLGTGPGRLTAVQIRLTGTVPGAVQGWRVRLIAGDPTWGDFVGMDFASTDAVEHIIDRVPPGPYTVIAQYKDGRRMLHLPVTVTDAAPLQEVVLPVPAGDASFSGVLLDRVGLSPVLFSDEHHLAVTLKANREGFYYVDGLPAGRYFIGNPYLRDKAPYAAFEIAAGQRKVVDINPQNWSNPGHGLLAVLVTDAHQAPIPMAQAWLEGPDGRIDSAVRTDREQIFVVPAGLYQLHAAYDGFETQQRDVSIEANEMMALHPDRSLVLMRLETH
jgi:hypothetical protein